MPVTGRANDNTAAFGELNFREVGNATKLTASRVVFALELLTVTK